jgi:hypothetical protein
MENFDETKTQALVLVGKELIPQRPALDEILKSLQIYIPPAAPTGPGGIWETPFSVFAEFFEKQSFPLDQIRLALINLLVLTSGHLGHPLILEIIDDAAAGAPDLVEKCMDLTGDFFWKSFTQMSQEDLIGAKDEIKGKTIVGLNSSGFEKGKENLNRFLANGKLITQPIIRSAKFGNFSPTIEIVGPTGCVLISKNPKKLVLTHPSFLGIHFKPTIQGFYVPELEEWGKAQLELDGDRIGASLQRLKENQVRILYRDTIIQHLQGLNHQSALAKAEMILRMLKGITIINYSSDLTAAEFYSRFYNSDPRNVELAKDLPGIPQDALTARKVDYYILWVLVSGMLRNEEVSFSERERRVFRVVKDCNEGALSTSFLSLNPTKFDKLAQIPKSPSTWPELEEIFKRVNRDGGEEIGSTATVYSVLQELEEKGALKNAKDPSGRKHGYYVRTWELSDTISLPDPSAIEDPVTGKDPIKVMNPITGAVDVV